MFFTRSKKKYTFRRFLMLTFGNETLTPLKNEVIFFILVKKISNKYAHNKYIYVRINILVNI